MKLFEEIYNETHHFSEVYSTTFSNLIRKAISDNKDMYSAGKSFGEKFARDPFKNTLQCWSNVKVNSFIERFSKIDLEFNTLLLSKFYNEVKRDFDNDNLDKIKDYFKGFIEALKAGGIMFQIKN